MLIKRLDFFLSHPDFYDEKMALAKWTQSRPKK